MPPQLYDPATSLVGGFIGPEPFATLDGVIQPVTRQRRNNTKVWERGNFWVSVGRRAKRSILTGFQDLSYPEETEDQLDVFSSMQGKYYTISINKRGTFVDYFNCKIIDVDDITQNLAVLLAGGGISNSPYNLITRWTIVREELF